MLACDLLPHLAMVDALLPGCHIIPPIDVPLAEQRRILQHMLARAPRCCKADITQALRRLKMVAECDKWAATYRAWAAAYYEDESIDEGRYVRGLCAR